MCNCNYATIRVTKISKKPKTKPTLMSRIKYNLKPGVYSIIHVFIDGLLGKLEIADDAVIKKRASHCKGCEWEIKPIGLSQCDICGCFLSAKRAVEKSVCPVGKW